MRSRGYGKAASSLLVQFSPDSANRFLSSPLLTELPPMLRCPTAAGPPATALHDNRLPCLFLLSCSAFLNVLSLARLERTIYFLNPGDATVC